MTSALNSGRKKPALRRAASRQLRNDLSLHARRIVGHARSLDGVDGEFGRLQREEDAFPRDRVDQPRRVADQQPVGAAQREPTEIRGVERRDRPGVRLEPRPGADAGRADPGRRSRAQRRRRDPPVGLRAHADRQMIEARERPEIPGRIAEQLERDFVRRDAVSEKSGGDRQLIAPKRRRQVATDDAADAVGADDDIGVERPPVGGGRRESRRRGERRPSPALSRTRRPPHAQRSAVVRRTRGGWRRGARRPRRVRSGTARLIPRAESMKRAERIRTADRADARWAGAISARARPVMPPPHGFSRGCEGSMSSTRAPRRASRNAAQLPLGPAPTMVMWRVVDTLDRYAAPFENSVPVPHGGGAHGAPARSGAGCRRAFAKRCGAVAP